MRIISSHVCILLSMVIALAFANPNPLMNNAFSSQLDYIEDCLKELEMEDLSYSSLHQVLQSDYENPFDRPSVQRTGCFIACMYQKQGIMDGAEIKIDTLVAIIKKIYGKNPELCQKIIDYVEGCANQVIHRQNKCAVALDFVTCLTPN